MSKTSSYSISFTKLMRIGCLKMVLGLMSKMNRLLKLLLIMRTFGFKFTSSPQNHQNERIAQIIGSLLGNYMKNSLSQLDGTWKAFIRVCVGLDTSLPLRCRMKVKPPRGAAKWVDFKYKRLPTFCFLCGMIRHAKKYCQKMFEIQPSASEKPFDPELKAQRRRQLLMMGQHGFKHSDKGDVSKRKVTVPRELEVLPNGPIVLPHFQQTNVPQSVWALLQTQERESNVELNPFQAEIFA
nr:uncharacterized protein LOC109152160 [Ipomoea batatas]